MDKIATVTQRMQPQNLTTTSMRLKEKTHPMTAVVRDVPAIVGANLRRLRKSQGHSLEKLAELSGREPGDAGPDRDRQERPDGKPAVEGGRRPRRPCRKPHRNRLDACAIVVLAKGDRRGHLAQRAGKYLRRPLFSPGRTQTAGVLRGPASLRGTGKAPRSSRTAPGKASSWRGAPIKIRPSPTKSRSTSPKATQSCSMPAPLHSYENTSGEDALVYLVVAHTTPTTG